MDTSNASNWIKLSILLNRANATLQELFIVSWKIKFGCEWDNSQSSIINTGVKNIGKDQLKRIEDGDISKWDITTLRAILFADSFLDLTHDQKESIKSIVDVRNKISHLPNNAVPQEQFDEWWKTLVLDLVGLGASETELEQLKVDSRVGGVEIILNKEEIINEANKTRAALLKEEGNVAFKTKNHTLAIELFSEGINLPEIPNWDRAVLLSNRVASYLKLYESSQDNKLLINGKEDAEAVIRIWPEWWRGYFRLGQVHVGLRNYQKAIEYLNVAFAKEPQIKEIADLLSNARRLLGEDERMEYFDPYKQCLSTADTVSKLNKKLGLTMSVDEMKKIEAVNDKLGISELENLELCRKGHRCRFGTDGFPRDYREAAKYYKTAADRGNAEGMYNIGQLYFEGQGVKQDFNEGLKWLRKAAAQSPFLVIKKRGKFRNLGVAEAQHKLGLSYAEGIGVAKNMCEAVKWYQRASDNECPNSANNLGSIYEQGILNSNPDLVKAEQYYRLAADHKTQPDCNAMFNLALLYFNQGDFERAMDWCRRAEENGSPPLHDLKSNIQQALDMCQDEQLNDDGLESENFKHSSSQVIGKRTELFSERHKMLKTLTEEKKIYTSKLMTPSPYSTTRFDPRELQKCAEYSKYGQTLWTAKKHCLAAFCLLKEVRVDGTQTSMAKYKAFVEELSAGAQIEFMVCGWPSEEVRKKAVSVTDLLMKQKLPFDEDVRVCYCALNFLHCPEEAVVFLDEYIRLYPKNVYFVQTRACMKSFQNRFEDGVRDAKLALTMDPNNIECLYHLAAMMRLTDGIKPDETIRAYTKFLELAPKDHRKVPEALYGIALETMKKLGLITKVGQTNEEEYLCEVKKCYDRGVAAEKDQLSFFLPYESNTKASVEYIFNLKAKLFHSSLPLSCSTETTTKDEGCKMDPKLTDSDRVSKIRDHRVSASGYKEIKSKTKTKDWRRSTVQPPKKQKLPQSMARLTPISLDGLDPTTDKVHDGFVFTATIIDELYFTGFSICVLLEDKNGCVERCFVYNLPYMHDRSEVKTVFSPGCKLSIMNPYMRMAADGKPAVRVDDPASVVFQGKIPKMCRYCCKPNANHLCGRCRVASYCDKNCQTVDWKEMKHKLVCEPLNV